MDALIKSICIDITGINNRYDNALLELPCNAGLDYLQAITKRTWNMYKKELKEILYPVITHKNYQAAIGYDGRILYKCSVDRLNRVKGYDKIRKKYLTPQVKEIKQLSEPKKIFSVTDYFTSDEPDRFGVTNFIFRINKEYLDRLYIKAIINNKEELMKITEQLLISNMNNEANKYFPEYKVYILGNYTNIKEISLLDYKETRDYVNIFIYFNAGA